VPVRMTETAITKAMERWPAAARRDLRRCRLPGLRLRLTTGRSGKLVPGLSRPVTAACVAFPWGVIRLIGRRTDSSIMAPLRIGRCRPA